MIVKGKKITKRTYSDAISKQTWNKLKAKAIKLKQGNALEKFFSKRGAGNTHGRIKEFTLAAAGFYLDYSKNYLDKEVMDLLFTALAEAKVTKKRNAMFRGEVINTTEARAVLHTLLRDVVSSRPFKKGGKNLKQEVETVREDFLKFAERVRTGKFTGVTGKKFQTVVSIGIGGSYLGVKMVYTALASYHDGPKILFVKNVDGFDLQHTLKQVELATTLFLIASKTFTTEETMTNAQTAKKIVEKKLGKEAVAKHFACMSTNLVAVKEFGIKQEHCFGFWDFVGGRYSLWSAIGLPLAISMGRERFMELLSGAHALDKHFKQASPRKNLPMILGLIHFFYATFMEYPTRAVLPYSERLSAFVGHLQQLEMESNGKSVDLAGNVIGYPTAPIVWGEAGTNGQHSFYQLLHQGTAAVIVDFIGFKDSGLNEKGLDNWSDHNAKLKAHLLAQGEALAFGFSQQAVEAQLAIETMDASQRSLQLANRTFQGGRPSNLLLAKKLTPETLGKLIALYEHKVFVEGVLWNINSFDQWGVELGKRISKQILKNFDPNTTANERKTSGCSLSTLQALDKLMP